MFFRKTAHNVKPVTPPLIIDPAQVRQQLNEIYRMPFSEAQKRVLEVAADLPRVQLVSGHEQIVNLLTQRGTETRLDTDLTLRAAIANLEQQLQRRHRGVLVWLSSE